MAIIASGYKTIIDLTDGKKLSVNLNSSVQKEQIYDVNTGNRNPNWAAEGSNVKLTPAAFIDNNVLAISQLSSIVWQYSLDGTTFLSIADSEDNSGYGTVTTEDDGTKVLIIKNNKLSESNPFLTYRVTVGYKDNTMSSAITASADITFVFLSTGKNGSTARSMSIEGEQVFKYVQGSTSPNPATIKLTMHLQNLDGASLRWEYKNTSGEYAILESGTDVVTINPNDKENNVFLGDEVGTGRTATIRAVAKYNNVEYTDVKSLYELIDGKAGNPGESVRLVYLDNENMTFVANKDGTMTKDTSYTTKVYSLNGEEEEIVKFDTTSSTTSGGFSITYTDGNNTNKYGIVTLKARAGENLTGDEYEGNGTIEIKITSPVNKTLSLNWNKIKNGDTGDPGASSVMVSIISNGNGTFRNQEGTVELIATGYEGAEAIASGATYAWYKYSNGNWLVVSSSGNSYTVKGSDVINSATYKCVMTYNKKTYEDTITLIDYTDPIYAEIWSTNGDSFKNGQIQTYLECRVKRNNTELDAYDANKTSYIYTYTWSALQADGVTPVYKLDEKGDIVTIKDDSNNDVPVSWSATGKRISITSNQVDSKSTFFCQVEEA